MLLRVLPWSLAFRQWDFSNSTVVHDNSHFGRDRKAERDRERGRDCNPPSRTPVHLSLAVRTHARRTLRDVRNFRKIVFRELWREGMIANFGGRWTLSLPRDGERRRTVGREGWRSTEAPASTCTRARCTSRVADTRVSAWPRACSEGGRMRARAQDGGCTCTIIIPLQRPTNF